TGAAYPAPRAAGEGGDRDHVRARRVPAPGAGCRGVGVPAQGRAVRGAGRGAAQGAWRRQGDRSAAGAGGLVGGGPAQRPRAPGAAPGRGGPFGGRDRGDARPVAGHGAQLSFRGDRQARGGQPDRGPPAGTAEGLAVAAAATAYTPAVETGEGTNHDQDEGTGEPARDRLACSVLETWSAW